LLTSIPTYTSSSITLLLTAHPTRPCTCGLVPCARPCQLFELWTLELADATILAKPRSLPTQVLTVCRARHYLHTPICRYKVLTKHNCPQARAAGLPRALRQTRLPRSRRHRLPKTQSRPRAQVPAQTRQTARLRTRRSLFRRDTTGSCFLGGRTGQSNASARLPGNDDGLCFD
jgi:hypothetical protein